jgi:N utilization substance protein A
VLSVKVDPSGTRICRVTVPDNQLSLAIGNRGQNARLAAKLTGWKIDIRPESGFYGEDEKDDFIEIDLTRDGTPAKAEETEE